MVDFQSRTSRLDDDEDEDEDESDTADTQQADGSEMPDEETDATPDPDGWFDRTVSYAILTVDDEATIPEDRAGDAIVSTLDSGGATVATRDLVNQSYDTVQSSVTALADRGDVDAIITVGGTGIEPDDVTVDALDPLFDTHLPGFGELFRSRARDFEGTGVVGNRTTAGVLDGTLVFAVPGTVSGASRATEDIILNEAPDLVAAAGRD